VASWEYILSCDLYGSINHISLWSRAFKS